MDTVIFPTKFAIVHLNSRKLTKSSRSVQLAIDGKGLSKDSVSVIILFAQKAKYCGGYQLKNVWLFVHVLNVLCWPAIAPFLEAQSGEHILDIACGNGLTSRRLA